MLRLNSVTALLLLLLPLGLLVAVRAGENLPELLLVLLLGLLHDFVFCAKALTPIISCLLRAFSSSCG